MSLQGRYMDISGNLNMPSNQLKVKHYSTPVVSFTLQSFVSVGVLATSLVAGILSISSAHLGAVGTFASERNNAVVSDFPMNLHGLVGHLQIFVLSDWLSVNPPTKYLGTTRWLMWLIPRHKLPLKNDCSSVLHHHVYLAKEIFERKSVGWSSHEGAGSPFNLANSSYMPQAVPVPIDMGSKSGWLLGQHSMRMTSYGSLLHSNEYFVYFLRGEPLSASSVFREMENYGGWEDLEMNLFWLGVGGGSLVILHVLILHFLRWRTGTPAHGILSLPRFELFLLILMLPCISQSSTFVIKGGTTGGIITGAMLLTIPAALILSVCLFQIVAIFSGSFVQYKEVKNLARKEPWYARLWYSFTGRPSAGKWFYKEAIPSSFLPRFGILFEGLKGPPLFVSADQNEPNSISKWTGSRNSGVRRMRPVSLDGSTEEIKIPLSERLLGCARSSYIVIDLSRRVCLGIICGAYSSKKSNQSLFALIITLVQFIYLLTLKPYINRGVQVVESISLLCEIGIFALFIDTNSGSNPVEGRNVGFLMLSLLFLTFIAQIINEWYALMKFLPSFSQPQNSSFKLGLRYAAKDLILPFLVQIQNPNAAVVREMRAPGANTISAMNAAVVPVLGPCSPGPNVLQMRPGSSLPRHQHLACRERKTRNSSKDSS